MGGKNIGDLLDCRRRDLGLLRGRLRPDASPIPTARTGCKRSTTSAITNANEGGLHSAPPAVPVLRLDRQPDARASDLGGHDRPQRRRRQSPVRHQRLLRRGQGRQLPGGELPEGAGIPGRPRRLLRSHSTSRPSSSHVINFLQKQPDMGRTPRSSSPTTTRTAGTTTRCGRS